MARGIWSGAISFGLINIPVSIMSAKGTEKISFRMLDKTDFAPIGYRQINKATGKEVDRKNIVKAYEYDANQFVVLNEKDFEKANPRATQTIDIEDFVELEEVDPLLYERPYYLVPGKNGEKGYMLLKKTLEKSGKAAIARFVMRKKQYLAAIFPRGEYLILEVLRFAHEVKEVEEASYLEDFDLSHVKISEREVKMAMQLVEGMTNKWDPRRYKDTYTDDLMKRIEQKAKGGDIETSPEIEAPRTTNTNVVDLTALLAKSLRTKTSEQRGSKKVSHASRNGAARAKSVGRKTSRSKSERLH